MREPKQNSKIDLNLEGTLAKKLKLKGQDHIVIRVIDFILAVIIPALLIVGGILLSVVLGMLEGSKGTKTTTRTKPKASGLIDDSIELTDRAITAYNDTLP